MKALRGCCSLPFYFILYIVLLIPIVAKAHPGNTDIYGCHTCYTNCDDWGYDYYEYHCHEPKNFNPQYNLTPTCPFFSSYDILSKSCKCYSGYVVSGGKCISGDSYCNNLFGYHAKYNAINDSCECRDGYVFDSKTNTCKDESSYYTQYADCPMFSSYDVSSKSCKCYSGYIANEGECITKDSFCKNLYGFHAKYNILEESCECNFGYVSDGKECVLDY